MVEAQVREHKSWISMGWLPYEVLHSQTGKDTVTISGKKRVLSFIYSIDLMASHRMP